MKKEVSFKIFSDFWINCYANDSLSYLISIEPSYRKVALMNWYNYFYTGSTCWWRTLILSYNTDFYTNIDKINYMPIYISKDDYINDIKNYINENRVIRVKFDLYYLIPSSINWHKNHYKHHVLISGYDDERKSFYCFSDNFKGYQEIEIPYDRFNQSILIEELDTAHEMVLSKDLKPFSYSIDQIKYNSDRIKYNISQLSYSNYWNCDDIETTNNRFIEITQFTDRQKANIFLFRDLYLDNILSDKIMNKLNNYTEQLYNKWENIKNIIIKAHFNSYLPDYCKLNDLAWDALLLEYEMWGIITRYL